jgi:hypothetical protein
MRVALNPARIRDYEAGDFVKVRFIREHQEFTRSAPSRRAMRPPFLRALMHSSMSGIVGRPAALWWLTRRLEPHNSDSMLPRSG